MNELEQRIDKCFAELKAYILNFANETGSVDIDVEITPGRIIYRIAKEEPPKVY